jgi:hypothetical protein
MGGTRGTHVGIEKGLSVKNCKNGDYLEDIGGRIILKWTSQK